MEKDLNLVELLKGAPKGTKLYSPICGECELAEVRDVDGDGAIKVQTRAKYTWSFAKNGHFLKERGECLLFPSRDNRDWSTFKVQKEGFKVGDHIINKETGEVRILTRKAQQPSEGFWIKRVNCSFNSTEVYIGEDDFNRYQKVEKFDPKWLKPFDRVLVRESTSDSWFATLFSHLRDDVCYPYVINNNCAYEHCIPYNEETKHLVGTTDTEPEFYKID